MINRKKAMRFRKGVFMLPIYEADNRQNRLIETKETMPFNLVSRLENGATHESVIVALMQDLTDRSKDKPSEEIKLAIRKLDSALRVIENLNLI